MKHKRPLSFSKSSGFTLVEVMISMVVFSLLMVLVSNAMSFATRYWTQEHGNLKERVSEFILTEKLYRSVAAMQPYGVKYQADRKFGIFFEGNSQSVKFVSTIGINQMGPVIIAMRIVEGEELGTQIQLAEEPLSSTMLVSPADLNRIQWDWKNIKSNLVSASFRFYGYDSLSQLMLDRSEIAQQAPKVGWYDSYNGHQTDILPLKLKFEWEEVQAQEVLNFDIDLPVMIDSRDRYNFIEKTLYVE